MGSKYGTRGSNSKTSTRPSIVDSRRLSTAAKVNNFPELLDEIERATTENPDCRLLFRGQSDNSWGVIPSLFRQKPDISSYEHDLVREMISAFPNDFNDDLTMFDKLVRMQHFGLPTRLVDVTTNPLVALYFACDPEDGADTDGAVILFIEDPSRHKFFDSDVVSCLANLANLTHDEKVTIAQSAATTIGDLAKLHAIDRLAQFIRVEKPYFVDRIKKIDLFRPVMVTPKRSNARLNAQFGEFLLFGLDSESGPTYDRSIKAKKIAIAAKAKSAIRARLENLGIHGATLFPEIDKAAKQICTKYASRVPLS